MTITFTAACIQNSATPDVHHNIARCLELTRAAAAEGARFIALPEYFSGLRTEGPRIIPVAFAEKPTIRSSRPSPRPRAISMSPSSSARLP